MYCRVYLSVKKCVMIPPPLLRKLIKRDGGRPSSKVDCSDRKESKANTKQAIGKEEGEASKRRVGRRGGVDGC